METKQLPPRSSGAVLGIGLLAIGFILTSIRQVGVLVDYSGYRVLFQHLPASLMHLRYLVSWGGLLLGLVTGVGLFYRKDLFRKAAVFFAAISSAGVFGKHSPEGFDQYLRLLSEKMAANGAPFSPASIIQFAHAWNITWLTESALAWGCIACLMILEISFYLAIIFFLTRPSVKALFRSKI
ncbi:MAG: hypothetical protein WCJ71_04155 [Candidatus Omnitrophota bacterium]